MIERLLRRILTADAIGLILVFVALQALTFGISASLKNTDARQVAYFFWVCLAAVLIAFGLSKQNLNGIHASVLLIVIGVMGIWIIAARLTLPLLHLADEILIVIPHVIPALRSHVPIDTTDILDAWRLVAETSGALSLRWQSWLLSLSDDVRVNDPLVLDMIWTLIMWLSATWMGWFAGRRSAITSLLPSIVLLAVVTSYSHYRIEMLWVMVVVLLLLMGLWNYRNHVTQWETKKIDYSDSIQFDAGQAVIFLSVVIGLIAFITPSISWREVRDYLRKRNETSTNQAADLLGLQQKPVIKESRPTQTPALPRDHLLTGGFAQSEKVVMVIRTGELPPVPDSHIPVNAPRYYWRSIVYDTYVGAGWVTSSSFPQKYQKNTPLLPGLLSGYKPLHLDVQLQEPEGKLFWSGVLFSADVPFTANWRLKPQSTLFADQAALLQADLFAARSDASAYQAEAYIPHVTIQQLRAASTAYPDEIKQKYLQLPGSVPARVIQLALDITKDQATPYDKAKAIESYLRRTYPYDLNVPAPPRDRDVADYFLFDLKKGYCDYYATAMVVLARASGVPARFVSGYAPGSYDAINAQYIVRELDAHSWVEVYFPDIGWVEFEPTASEPEIDRALSDPELTNKPPQDSFANRLLFRFRFEKVTSLLLPFALLLFGLISYYTWIERWCYMRLEPVTAIEKIYRRLYRLGRPLAGERTKAETAYEFMRKLVDQIEVLCINKLPRFAKLFSSAQQDIKLLTGLYQDTLFSHEEIQKNDTRNALKRWRHLRWRLWIARLYVIASRRRLRSILKGSNLLAVYMRLLRIFIPSINVRDLHPQ